MHVGRCVLIPLTLLVGVKGTLHLLGVLGVHREALGGVLGQESMIGAQAGH